MLIHHAKIKRAFSRAATTYDTHATMQQTIGETLIHALPRKHYSSVIDLGCGSGLTTEKLFHAVIAKHFSAIDLSPTLLEVALSKRHPDILFQLDNYDTYRSPAPIDLVFSNMALQWSDHFFDTLTRYASFLKTKGHLAFSIPLAGTLAEIAPHFSINSFEKATTILSFFEQPGIRLIHFQQAAFTHRFENTLHALRSLKLTGANHVFSKKRARYGKQHFRNLAIDALTYQIGYFIVEKHS